jgi:methyl-accepting chemotaxis protein
MRAVAGEVAAEKVAAIVDNAPQAFDTLKEIAEWIQGSDKYASDALDLATDIQALEDAVFGTNTEDGLADKTEALEQSVGTLQTNLQNLTEGFNSLHAVVGDSSTGLVKKVNDINTTVNNHTTQISELAEKLMWNELVEE